MSKFFAAKSNFQICLSISTLAFALNSANGASLPATSHQTLPFVVIHANRIATGPTFPPPVDEDLHIAA